MIKDASANFGQKKTKKRRQRDRKNETGKEHYERPEKIILQRGGNFLQHTHNSRN